MEDEIDELFSSDPSAFTAERDALAKRLRTEGEKERAAEIKALRRPTTAAWAVNQVARRHPQMVEEVRSAGQELERAQRRMMSGLRDVDLQAATRQRRAAVDVAVDAAAGFLSALGTRPDPHLDKLRATFEAASMGGEDLEVVGSGRLAKELPPPSGFGGVQGLELLAGDVDRATAAARAGGEQETASETDTAAEAEARAAAERARAAADQARERADAAVDRARAARHHAAELERSLEDAESEAAALERAAVDARRRADALATDVEDAREDERRLADAARRRADDLREAESRLP